MNASMKKTLIALAVATLFGSSMAYANDHGHDRPKVDSAATASVDNDQSISRNFATNDKLTNSSSISDNTASQASGNIGMNVAAGDNNAQDNAAALAATDASFAFGVADSDVDVNQGGWGNLTFNRGVTNDASIGDNAFQYASGNIGANVASGNNNEQKNALAASVATTEFAHANVDVDQNSSHNAVSNAGFVQKYYDTTRVHLSGTVQGYSLGLGLGGYAGSTSSTSQGTESGGVSVFGYPIASYGGTTSSTSQGSEQGGLGFVELSASDLYADLCGTVQTARWVVVDATNDASLSGNAFQHATGNIGVNVASGTGNLQANTLSMAVAQPTP
ncbi:hypothetical protein [Frateuria terrea]|uniref:Heme utilization protein n=1 Tax=Frateuria terrea TaxID=529704 RepID=A0A1H6WFE2_9GAMM|nr:hypothetical protein [Frateuria terrea]SEJ15739.1 hypothetical protein SAMN04487997_2574 [Frateuria terrea]SFP55475.1 hypothetical protein SAMN02927913_2551 [Frateuria terrea]